MTAAEVELQQQAHSDTAREECRTELQMAVIALKHGEDDTAIAHMIDAVRYLGRAQVFLEVAKDLCEFVEDEEP